MEKAHAISERWGKAPVALAGDFNSTPDVITLINLQFLSFVIITLLDLFYLMLEESLAPSSIVVAVT